MSLNDIVHQDQKSRWSNFSNEMSEFPCLFNLGNCNLDVGSTKYGGGKITEPDVPRSKWEYIRDNLKNDYDDSDFEEAVWRDNLLTLVSAELDSLEMAIYQNQKIQDRYGKSNLVALANAAFLYFNRNDLKRAHTIKGDLKKLSLGDEFSVLKLEAICEQGYVFRKFGGAGNLLCSISLLRFATSFHQCDERFHFMLAMVYRRCTDFNIYTESPENISRSICAENAALSLFKLGNSARSKAIRSAAFIELAYLKNEDDIIEEQEIVDEQSKLTRLQWSSIVGEYDWKYLCKKSIEIGGDDLSEKVLKIAGQLFRCCQTDDDLVRSEQFLKKAIHIKPTNRAHHHLGLTYKEMAKQFEQKNHSHNIPKVSNESNLQSVTDGKMRLLPAPSTNGSLLKLNSNLKYIRKVPGVEEQHFSKDNPLTHLAIDHFKQAAELSYNQNRPAVYDLENMLAQIGRYEDSKMTCNILFKECTNTRSIIYDPIYLISAHNLYGLCCAKEARETPEDNKDLLAESEKYLILTVRLASHLASKVSELATCATDLWTAFKTLKTEFMSGMQKESREKLLSLCTFIHDYRYLQAVDEIISQDPTVWENAEFIEGCLRSYLKLKTFDSALLFRDMAYIHLKGRGKLRILKSEVFRKLLLEIAELNLDKTFVKTVKGVYCPDPVWKQLLQEEFEAIGHLKTYDIVIVDDINNNYEVDLGTLSDNISRYFKEVLQKTFGLKTARAHEECLPGSWYLNDQPEIISKSHVAIFVLTKPCIDSQYFETEVKANDKSSESEYGGQETSIVEKVKKSDSLPQEYVSHMEPAAAGLSSENFLTEKFKWIINCSMSSYISKISASRVMLVIPDHLKHEDLPQSVRALTSFRLSEKDVIMLAHASQDIGSDQSIYLLKKIFRSVLNKSSC